MLSVGPLVHHTVVHMPFYITTPVLLVVLFFQELFGLDFSWVRCGHLLVYLIQQSDSQVILAWHI